ncbi:hypothetical protein [Herbihabitans rhizosphaerae]|nr:hypothetical protein [Herbihabitans rhizosphaerae]
MPDGDGQWSKPTTAAFTPGAAAGLAPVAGGVADAKQSAVLGDLHLDPVAADTLLKALAKIKVRAKQLLRDSGDLDAPLRFGDSWVADIMAKRLRQVAVGNGSVAAVLTEFERIVEDMELTVRAAAGDYIARDQAAKERLEKAANRIGVEVIGGPA